MLSQNLIVSIWTRGGGGGGHRAIEIISIAWGSIQNFQRKVLLQDHIANNTYLLEVLLLKNPIE